MFRPLHELIGVITVVGIDGTADACADRDGRILQDNGCLKVIDAIFSRHGVSY